MRNIHTFPVTKSTPTQPSATVNPFPVTPTPVPVPVPVQPAGPPVFTFESTMLDSTVTVSWMGAFGQIQTQPVPSDYCATQDAAVLFQSWLAANGKKVTIFQAYPLYPQGVGNLEPQSKMTPWFLDPVTGVENNAGLQIVQFRQTPLPNGGYTGMPYSEAVSTVLAAWPAAPATN